MINTLNLSNSALEIYENNYKYPESKIAQRCLDYKYLETLSEK